MGGPRISRMGTNGQRAGRTVEDVEVYGLPNDDDDGKGRDGIPNDWNTEFGAPVGAACSFRPK